MWIDSQKLNLLIAEQDIPIKVLCMKLGIAQSALSRLCKGEHKPRLSTFTKLSKVLNVPISAFVDFNRYDRKHSRKLIPRSNRKFRN
ncbi:MAG: helix-turn-helix domain-containing protein [Treponema sp.]|nr:helix-turn-helix domain-containing protein [Treponema sp.]